MNRHDIRDAIEAGKRKANEATAQARRDEEDFEPNPYEPVALPEHRREQPARRLTRAERLAAMEGNGRTMPEAIREVFLKGEAT